MAGPRGYHNYRGRTSKGKIVLAVVLVLVILAAIAVMILQRYIVYDEKGRPRLEMPWQEDTPTEDGDPADFELKIQEPEGLGPVRAFAVKEQPLTQAVWGEAYSAFQMPQNAEQAYNAAAVTLKGPDGSVYFDSATAVAGAVSLGEDTAEVIALMTGSSYESAIARLSCFHDPKAANSDVEAMGLKNTGGYIFYDGNNSQWLDPGKPAARQYLCEIAKQAAAMGFDEILLADVSYPAEGQLDKIDYGEGEQRQNLLTFLEEMRAALEPYSVALSVEIPETVITGDGGQNTGLTLAELAPRVDRIYTATTPEKIQRLSEAVAAASGTTDFVAELAEYTAEVSGSCLIGLN